MYSTTKYSDHIHHLREFGYVHIKSIINQNKINDFRNTFFLYLIFIVIIKLKVILTVRNLFTN